MRIVLHAKFRVQLQHTRAVGDVKFGKVGVLDVPHELVFVVADDRRVVAEIPIA
jgi:hypothetical protein